MTQEEARVRLRFFKKWTDKLARSNNFFHIILPKGMIIPLVVVVYYNCADFGNSVGIDPTIDQIIIRDKFVSTSFRKLMLRLLFLHLGNQCKK